MTLESFEIINRDLIYWVYFIHSSANVFPKESSGHAELAKG